MDKKKLIYIGSIALITILVSVTYFSYAFFTNKQEFHGKLNIVAGTLDYKVDSADLTNNAITVPANSVKMLNISLRSLNKIQSNYILYYSTASASVTAAYAVATTDLPSGSIGTTGVTKAVTVVVKNDTSSAQTVTFGVQGGFTGKTVALESGKKTISAPYIVNASELTYSNSTYTTKTNVKDALDELFTYTQ